jgi:hypothetical protein
VQRMRLSGDLDVMVRRSDLHRTLAVLASQNWRMRDYSVARQLRKIRVRPGINLSNIDGGDIDIHHQPIHLRWMSDRVLERFWQRAKLATFGGRDILIPSTADLLCISASHGLRRNIAHGVCYGAWAIDFHHLFNAPHAPLESLPEIAHELGVAIHVWSALLFLQQSLGMPVDPHLLAALKRRSQGIGARLRYYVDTPAKSARGQTNRRLLRRAMRFRLALLSYLTDFPDPALSTPDQTS